MPRPENEPEGRGTQRAEALRFEPITSKDTEMKQTPAANSNPTNGLAKHARDTVLPTAFYVTQGSMGIMSTIELRGSCLY